MKWNKPFEEFDVVEFQNIPDDEDSEFYGLNNGEVGTIVHIYPSRLGSDGFPCEEQHYEIEYDIQENGPSKLATVPESKIRHKLYKI